ncbi:probable amidase At4g34880 [Quercus lobata]|uniref:probable amidase At4g34880 n=1 Tax=Quercus lobata TaxID=97700 RepID=UPI0012444764|nr:probable amidase At4g34880 [Quercus lobata]
MQSINDLSSYEINPADRWEPLKSLIIGLEALLEKALTTLTASPQSHRYKALTQSTEGRPICRIVADAVYVLDAIVGIDHYDNATIETSRHIRKGGYAQFLKINGLRAKRVGIVRKPFYNFGIDIIATRTIEQQLKTPRFYLQLDVSVMRLLFYTIMEEDSGNISNYEQDLFIKAKATNGIGNAEKVRLSNLAKLTREGFVKLMTKNKLDAIVTPGKSLSRVLAIGGFPGVIVPAGYNSDGEALGLCFGGLEGSEPKLIEITYGFEQATKIKKPPNKLKT